MSEPLQIQRGVARTMWISMLGENPSKFQVTICFLHKNKIDLFSLGMCGHFIRQSLKNHKVQLSPPPKKKHPQEPFLKRIPLSLAQFPETSVKYSKENL